MRVVISGGGTGGHIYPAISIINKLKQEYTNLEVIYVGTTTRMESEMIPKLGIEYYGIKMIGASKNILKLIKLFGYLIVNYFKLKKLYKKFEPDIVIGTGGYVTVPVIMAASRKNIPTLIFDADYNFGKATKALIKRVDTVCCAFSKNADGGKIVYTGNPRAQEVFENVVIDKGNKILFVFGSLGSSTVNKFFLDYFNSNKLNYDITYVTGKGMYEEFVKSLKNDEIEVVEYCDDIYEELKDTRFIVTRSGATFLSEVTALKIPAIYIPSPYVANNEQVLNVKGIEEQGGCKAVLEKDLEIESFSSKLDSLVCSEESMINVLEEIRTVDSLDKIVGEVRKLM